MIHRWQKKDGYVCNNGCYDSKLHANSVFSFSSVQHMRAPGFSLSISPQLHILFHHAYFRITQKLKLKATTLSCTFLFFQIKPQTGRKLLALWRKTQKSIEVALLFCLYAPLFQTNKIFRATERTKNRKGGLRNMLHWGENQNKVSFSL